MILNNGYYIWKKGERTRLSSHFSTNEFTCRCDYPTCDKQTVAKALVDKLEDASGLLKMPIIVTSGFRCKKKQEALAAAGYETAKGVSQHEIGNAADLHCQNMQQLVTVCSVLFRAMGIAKNFIHVDLRNDRERKWAYYHS